MCVFSIKSFSMYSCGHFCDFLSDDLDPDVKSKSQCREEVTRRARMNTFQPRNQHHVWCCVSVSKVVRKFLRKVWDLGSIWSMSMNEKKEQPGNWYFPTHVKHGYSQASRQDKSPHASRKLVPENQEEAESEERDNIPTPRAQGNLQLQHRN